MQITKRIKLDFARSSCPVSVFAKQGDENSRFVEIEPLENGQPYIIPSGLTVAFACRKPDGHQVLIDGATSESGYPKIDYDKNVIVVELTAQTLAAAGHANAMIALKTAGKVLSTQNFILLIEKSALVGASVESSDEYQGYIAALAKVEELLEKALSLTLTEIVQTTGDSESAVMSQKAVTDDLNKIKKAVNKSVGEATVGIVNTSGTVYSDSDTYKGRHIILTVSGGEKYTITGTNINYNYPVAFVRGGADFGGYQLLKDADGNTVGGNDAGTNYTNVEVTIPEGATTLYVNGYNGSISVETSTMEYNVVSKDNITQTTGDSETSVMSQKAVTEELDNFKYTHTSVAEIGEAVVGIVQTNGTVYSGGDTYTGRHMIIPVSGGETYIITGTNINYMYPVVFVKGIPGYTYSLLTDADGNTIGGNETNTDYVKIEVTIPDGATTLYVNGYNGKTNNPLIFCGKNETRKSYKEITHPKLHILIRDGDLYATSKYGEDDITVRFGKRGGNNLPDFITFYTSQNSEFAPMFDEDALVSFNRPDTDWHAPFVVQAVNNIDGDLPDGYESHFTGGNHGYNNTGTGSTATARCETLKYFVNEKEVKEYNDYADNVCIFWRNYVQGNNTKKADGTGREILIEEHTMTFDGVEWKTEVELIPIEDIIIKSWYGLQLCGLSSSRYSKIRYINATNRLEYDVTASSISGNNNANGMIASGDEHCVRCEVDPNFDLGKREFYTGSQGAFALSYGKAYFFIISGTETFSAATHYYLRGNYKFYPAI